MNQERRKYPRVPVYMKVINETKEIDFGFSYASDISAGGLALDTKVILDNKINLKEGSILKIKFKIPGGRLYITAIGEVTRLGKNGNTDKTIGLKFTDLEDDFRKEIQVFVDQSKKGNISFS